MDVAVGPLRFDVDDRGEGEHGTVMLLHGFPATKASWRHVTPPLVDAGYRVVAPDQRGYSPGARPRRRRDYALDLLVGDVLGIADALGIDRFHVVGHDWGGAVAWAVAAAHPDRVLSLTSLGTPHPRAMLRAEVTSSQILRSWYMVAFQVPAVPEAVVASERGGRQVARTLVGSGLSPADADAAVAMLRAGAARGAIGWYRALPFGASSPVGPVAVPTLYAYGTADRFIGPKGAELSARWVSGAYRFVPLDGASHWLPEQHAADVVPLLLDHLDDDGRWRPS